MALAVEGELMKAGCFQRVHVVLGGGNGSNKDTLGF